MRFKLISWQFLARQQVALAAALAVSECWSFRGVRRGLGGVGLREAWAGWEATRVCNDAADGLTGAAASATGGLPHQDVVRCCCTRRRRRMQARVSQMAVCVEGLRAALEALDQVPQVREGARAILEWK
jgi:hypothetical protein